MKQFHSVWRRIGLYAAVLTGAFAVTLTAAALHPAKVSALGNVDPSYGADERVEMDGHYYQVFNQGLRWEEAKAYCESIGGHLVTITNQKEENLIEDLLSIHGGINYWMGAEKVNGQMAWVTGEDFSFTNWGPSQPDHAHETSLMMYTYDNPNTSGDDSYQWNDLEPGGTYGTEPWFGLDDFGFICEWDYNNTTLTSLSIKSLPKQTDYYLNSDAKLKTAGMVLKATYSDGYVSYIKSGFTCSPVQFSQLGQQKVVVSYKGRSTGFYVNVHKEVKSAAIKKKPTKQVYFAGEKFDPSGMKLKVTYADGTTEEVTGGFTYTPSGKFTEDGQQKVVVTFGGRATGFYVTVKKEVKAVAIKAMPTKRTYGEGEAFQADGLKLKVTNADDTTEEVTEGFTYTPNGKLTTAGQQKIVVTYGGKSTGFYVTVTKAVSSVTIKKKPTKQTYMVGESFESAGMILKITYADDTTEEVTSGFTYTPNGKLTTAGQQKIVVTYGGKSTGFYVTVTKAVSSVTIKKKPTKQTYTVGESFESAGMILKITYADSTTEEVTGGFTCTPTGKLTTAGQQKIVVTYGGKATGFYVTVNKAVSSVTIKKKPTKQTYTVGESFESAGMILKITYADGTTEEVTGGFTCTPTGKLTTAGQQKIVVTCGGKSTGFYVTVNE